MIYLKTTAHSHPARTETRNPQQYGCDKKMAKADLFKYKGMGLFDAVQ